MDCAENPHHYPSAMMWILPFKFSSYPIKEKKVYQGDAEDGTNAARRGNDDYRKRTAGGDRSAEISDGEYRKMSAAKGIPSEKRDDKTFIEREAKSMICMQRGGLSQFTRHEVQGGKIESIEGEIRTWK